MLVSGTLSAMTRPSIIISTSTTALTVGLLRENSGTGRNYSAATALAGGLPAMAAILEPDLAPAYAEQYDGLILSGGADVDPVEFGQQPNPNLGMVDVRRDKFEIALYHAFIEAGKPILGICRGLQVINVAAGGTLHQHIGDIAGTWQHSQQAIDGTPFHEVSLTPRSRLAAGFGTERIRTNTYHHQSIDQVAPGYDVTAVAGDGIIEAIESQSGPFVLGVQWHPEMSFQMHPEHHVPFKLFLDAVRAQQ